MQIFDHSKTILFVIIFPKLHRIHWFSMLREISEYSIQGFSGFVKHLLEGLQTSQHSHVKDSLWQILAFVEDAKEAFLFW